jgi:hypothetical protein
LIDGGTGFSSKIRFRFEPSPFRVMNLRYPFFSRVGLNAGTAMTPAKVQPALPRARIAALLKG